MKTLNHAMALACAALMLLPRAPRAQEESGGQSLASQAADPTASLASYTFTEIWTADYWDLDRDGFTLRFRPVIPFKLWGVGNILRITLPFDHGGVPGYGLADVQIFDLLIFPGGGGRFGIGPLVNLASANSRTTPSPFAIGPSVGYVYATKKYNLGLFNQNVFGSNFGSSSFQPVGAWQLNYGIELAPGDLQYTYDWENGEWTSVPMGLQVAELFAVAKQPIRIYVNGQYNFMDTAGLPRWVYQFALVLLLP